MRKLPQIVKLQDVLHLYPLVCSDLDNLLTYCLLGANKSDIVVRLLLIYFVKGSGSGLPFHQYKAILTPLPAIACNCISSLDVHHSKHSS